MPDFTDHQYHLSRESGIIIGIAFEIHNILGKGFLEIVYKDAIEFEFRKREIPFTREKEYKIQRHRTSSQVFC
jgi:GxxExxY protein